METFSTYRKFQKNFENKSDFFSQFLVFRELLSPVVEKVVFDFEAFSALDMAPTWAVPGLFFSYTNCFTLVVFFWGDRHTPKSGITAVRLKLF